MRYAGEFFLNDNHETFFYAEFEKKGVGIPRNCEAELKFKNKRIKTGWRDETSLKPTVNIRGLRKVLLFSLNEKANEIRFYDFLGKKPQSVPYSYTEAKNETLTIHLTSENAPDVKIKRKIGELLHNW